MCTWVCCVGVAELNITIQIEKQMLVKYTLKYTHPFLEGAIKFIAILGNILHTNNMHPPTHSQNM